MVALIYFLTVLGCGIFIGPYTPFPLNAMLGSAVLGLLVVGIVIFDRREKGGK